MSEHLDPIDDLVRRAYSEDHHPSGGDAVRAAIVEKAIATALSQRQPRAGLPMRWAIGALAGIAAAAVLALFITARPSGTAGHARYSFIVPGAAEYSEDTSTLRLSSGTVRVSVDPKPHRRFRVQTKNFIVEVTGTVFTVSESETRVLEGSVRILSPSGSVVRAEVRAGQSFTFSEKPGGAEHPTSDPSGELPTQGLPTAPESVQLGKAENLPPSQDSPPVVGSASASINLARQAIRRGETTEAIRLLDEAERASPSSEQLGLIKLLRADCAQLERDPTASRLYRDASASRLEREATEAALFSAAKTAAEAGQHAEAARLFESYLKQFPRGALRREAKARLEELRERD